MHTIGRTMQQVQVNTKFLNALSQEWRKFVTNVKLAKNLYTTNYDQLYAYLSRHERHANETEDLNAYDLNCDDISSTKAVMMANLSRCDSDVLYEVGKKRTTSDAISAGARGFEHTKACFVTNIIPFLKVLKDPFNTFDKTLLDEITEVQTVFNQMGAVVDQCSVDQNTFKIQIKQLSIDNDQPLNQIMSQEIMHITVNYVDILNVNKSCMDGCNKCLELESELLKKKDLIEKDVYDKLLKSYSTLEKH
nr:retrovirus-related Pol polyprotein from transposon TNT 1-94 [Tanacetum cinerariifolium]